MSGTLEQVRAAYGAPTEQREGSDADYPAGSGYATYHWKLGVNLLAVDTEFYLDDGGRRIEGIVAATIRGTRPDRRLRTGRGLGLGDTWASAQLLYGGTYVDGTVNGPTLGRKTVTYCFSDETELEVGLDDEQRVVALWLAPSAE